MPTGGRKVTVLRAILWMLFVLTSIWAFVFFWTGLAFGFALFRLSDPWPTLVWLMVLALPFVVFHTLRHAGSDLKKLGITILGTLAFILCYAVLLVR